MLGSASLKFRGSPFLQNPPTLTAMFKLVSELSCLLKHWGLLTSAIDTVHRSKICIALPYILSGPVYTTFCKTRHGADRALPGDYFYG
jgi:hypothetical protein